MPVEPSPLIPGVPVLSDYHAKHDIELPPDPESIRRAQQAAVRAALRDGAGFTCEKTLDRYLATCAAVGVDPLTFLHGVEIPWDAVGVDVFTVPVRHGNAVVRWPRMTPR